MILASTKWLSNWVSSACRCTVHCWITLKRLEMNTAKSTGTSMLEEQIFWLPQGTISYFQFRHTAVCFRHCYWTILVHYLLTQSELVLSVRGQSQPHRTLSSNLIKLVRYENFSWSSAEIISTVIFNRAYTYPLSLN